MVKTAGRQVNVGIGIEVTPGTAVAPAIFAKWQDFAMNPVSEKLLLNSARGVRNESSDSKIVKKYGEGSVGFVMDVEIAAYFLRLALGGAVTTAEDEVGVYTHTMDELNTNASMKTFTVTSEEGGIVTEQYSNCVVNNWTIEFSDGWVNCTMDIISKFPASSSLTESYAEETELVYSDATLKFGTSVTNAESASATPVKSFSLSGANNVMLDESFLSGSNEPVSGCVIPGNQKITGNYSIHFEDTTELDKYKANTKNALVMSAVGASIGATEQEEVKIKLARIVLTSPPKEFNIDGLIVLNQEFEVEYNSSEGYAIKAEVTNEEANSGGTVYTPA